MSPSGATDGRVTGLLKAWGEGDASALDSLMPLVHDELKRLARRSMARERSSHTLQPTALVNEAYVRLARENRMTWQNRSHFLAVAAQLMRFILVDHARSRQVDKRGGDARHMTIDAGFDVADPRAAGVLQIDDALSGLARQDARKAKVAEMRLFAGLSVEECAHVLSVSSVTVMRDWRLAKAWLQRELAR